MAQHKWHKEIKAWADGAEIEHRWETEEGWSAWTKLLVTTAIWTEQFHEYRIKPQPKEPQCKKHKDAPHGFCRDASASEDRYVCECEFWEEPKEPQYLYVYARDGLINYIYKEPRGWAEDFVGKIKLEVDE